jgi:hypothetical protein
VRQFPCYPVEMQGRRLPIPALRTLLAASFQDSLTAQGASLGRRYCHQLLLSTRNPTVSNNLSHANEPILTRRHRREQACREQFLRARRSPDRHRRRSRRRGGAAQGPPRPRLHGHRQLHRRRHLSPPPCTKPAPMAFAPCSALYPHPPCPPPRQPSSARRRRRAWQPSRRAIMYFTAERGRP